MSKNRNRFKTRENMTRKPKRKRRRVPFSHLLTTELLRESRL